MPRRRGVIGSRLAASQAPFSQGYGHGRVRRRLPAQSHDWLRIHGGRRVVRLRLVSISAAGAFPFKFLGQETIHHVCHRHPETRSLSVRTPLSSTPNGHEQQGKSPDDDPRHVSPPRRVFAIAVFTNSHVFRGGRLRDGQPGLHHPFEAEPFHAERMGFGLTSGEPRRLAPGVGQRSSTPREFVAISHYRVRRRCNRRHIALSITPFRGNGRH